MTSSAPARGSALPAWRRTAPSQRVSRRRTENGSRLRNPPPTFCNSSARYLLTIDARTAAAVPLNESHPELQAKGKKTADEKLSVAFLKQAQTHRIATLDQSLATMRKAMKKVG